jgi:colicin import membrane protein
MSFALHLTAFLIIFLVIKQSNRITIPSPYIVNLVSPDILASKDTEKNIMDIPEASEEPAPVVSKKKIKKITGESKRRAEDHKTIVEGKIAVIAAKKRVEKTVKLRSLISLKASDTKAKSHTKTISAHTGKGEDSFFNAYYAKITKEIWQQWIWTDTSQKDLEAIISVKILKDGTTLVKKMEKSSGNLLFDKSAMRAITRANPLPPPPYEMEIGVRFYP